MHLTFRQLWIQNMTRVVDVKDPVNRDFAQGKIDAQVNKRAAEGRGLVVVFTELSADSCPPRSG